jgi:sulfur transfer protein SufE
VTDEEILNSEIGEVTEAEEQARYLIGLGKELPKDIEDELLRTLEVRKKRNKIWESHRNTRKLSEDIIWSVLKKFGFKG